MLVSPFFRCRAQVESLKRTYGVRFNMGLFDPNDESPYGNITTDVVGCQEHQDLSALASRKAMVLLKNDGNTLPFSRGKAVAVIGVSSNSTEDLLGNYDGPICPDGGFDCYPTIFTAFQAANSGGSVSLVDDASKVEEAVAAAKAADYVVLTASNFLDGGGEGHDR